MNREIMLGGRRIAADAPVFIVAEMSANHLQDYDRAVRILHAAKEAGADAVKLQTLPPIPSPLTETASCFASAEVRCGTVSPIINSTSRRIRPGNGTPS